ncbi:MAG: AraC family transcriptional regulator ligand-binding domain-containing protein, partial [Ectothiorhodospiraceae bacterium]
MERARELSGDPHIGLHHGRQFRPDSIGVLGHVLLCARDLDAAFDALGRFQALVGDGIRLRPTHGPK